MAIKCPKCQFENTSDSKFCKECGAQLLATKDIGVTKTLITPTTGLQKGSAFAGRYQLIEELGRGGMGVVYKAEDTKLKRTVALKFLPPELTHIPEVKERFMREAQAAAALNHPNICTVYEIDEAEDRTSISMEYIDGKTLKDRIESGPLDVDEAVNIVTQVAKGLGEAHAKGIVHRDIKPANIMLTDKGTAKIMDFGIAKLAGGGDLTKPSNLIGTVAYMAPEQAQGEEVDRRTDIWSLGAVFYEMLAGKRPFAQTHEQALIFAVLNEEPKPISSLRSDTPSHISNVIQKALNKDASKRFQSAGEFIQGLEKPATVSSSQHEKSIAVLPFANMSADPEQEYFCDGISEEIINALTQLSDLKVVARTSAFSFKDKDADIEEIGKKLKVHKVLEGSVRKAGNRLRITAQLINVADGYHLWSERFDREMEDVFAIQDEITSAIVDKLKLELLGGEREKLLKRYTDSAEAFELYSKGVYFLNKFELEKSLEYFHQAIEEDPAYALAYTGIGWNYNTLGNWGHLSPKEAFPSAKEAAEKALEIDETLGFAHSVLGTTKLLYDWDWEASEREFKRALELNPNYAGNHHGYAIYFMAMGRLDKAYAEIKRALELDPLSLQMAESLGFIFIYMRQYDRAIEQFKKVLEMNPNYIVARQFLAIVYAEKGMYDEAIAEAKKLRELWGRNKKTLPTLGFIYANSGKKEEAKEILDELLELEKQEYIAPSLFALSNGYLGDVDSAFEWLEKAYEENDPNLVWIKVLPLFDPLRSDQRFKAMLEKMNLE